MTSPKTLRSPDKPSAGVAPLSDTVATAVVDDAVPVPLVLEVNVVTSDPAAEVVVSVRYVTVAVSVEKELVLLGVGTGHDVGHP